MRVLRISKGRNVVEFLDVVDENEGVVDKRPRSERLDGGLLHRAVTIFITNDEGKVFLQKRANDIRFYPAYGAHRVGATSLPEKPTPKEPREN